MPKSKKDAENPIRSVSAYGTRVEECRHLATLDKGMREVTDLADTLVFYASLVAIYQQAVERSRLSGESWAPWNNLVLRSIALSHLYERPISLLWFRAM